MPTPAPVGASRTADAVPYESEYHEPSIAAGYMTGETVYDFEWDPAKALANIRKHGVSFDAAATVLLDRLALTVYDEARSQHEERWFTLGLDASGNLLAVAHTYEIVEPASVRIRIISARKATRRERHSYEDESR